MQNLIGKYTERIIKCKKNKKIIRCNVEEKSANRKYEIRSKQKFCSL